MDDTALALFPILEAAEKLIFELTKKGIITPGNQIRFKDTIDALKTDCLNAGMDANSIDATLQPGVMIDPDTGPYTLLD